MAPRTEGPSIMAGYRVGQKGWPKGLAKKFVPCPPYLNFLRGYKMEMAT